jgi:glutamate-ammonia-ligase adenylyltransferase
VKARVSAGEPDLGRRVIAIATRAAYERGAPDPQRIHYLRGRMERELGHERLDRSPARYDLKVGRGGLVDIEFATQWLQMRHGADSRVRTTETEVALSALETCGYLEPPLAEVLRDGWRFLRRLEQRLRISHGTSVRLLEEGAPGLVILARRMGMRDGPRVGPDHALLERYTAVTEEVRAAYLRVLGLA